MTKTPSCLSDRSDPCRAPAALCLASSLLALALALAGRAQAQTAAPAASPPATTTTTTTTTTAAPQAPVVLEQMVVTGVRASLISAQEIKQNSIEMVDSVVAQDIGKFPDNTVAEALQRVPGVQVSHTAGEANGVVVRGLPNIETTVNGYEVFTGTGRGVALQDIPAEMLAGIDTYKTVGPDKIEGGVAGLIDIRLRRPFDFAGQALALNARGYYSDQAKKDSYAVSGLASDRWKTGGGEFGVLVDVSDSHQLYEDQIADNYVHFGANGETFDLAPTTAPAGTTKAYYADNYGFQLIPGKRTRPAVSLMLQWKNDNGLQLYSDNLFTAYRNEHAVDFFIAIPSFGGFTDNVTLFPAGFQGYSVPEKFDTLGTPARFVQSLIAHNTNTIASKQAFHDTTDTYQGAVGGIWERGRLKWTNELSYNITTVRTRGVILDTIIVVSPTIAITYHLNDPSAVNLSGLNYADPTNYHLSQYFDQWDRDHSVQAAFKSEAVISLDHSFLSSTAFGIRYADRGVDSHSANPGSFGLPFATLASSIPGLETLSASTPFVSAGYLNVRQWATPNENFLLSNTDVIRKIAGRPLGLPPPDPSRTFLDDEREFAPYALANYKGTIGDMPLDGEFGLRMTDTRQTLAGYQQTLVNGNTSGAFAKTTVDTGRWYALPTVNGRLKLQDDLYLRGSFTKTVTRPDFASLNPAVSVTSPGPTIQGSGSGGNPNLSAIQSTNYDVDLEYYPSKSNQVTVAGFYRTIEGYIQNYASQETIGTNSYSITRPRSTHDGYLEGAEASYQEFFDFLPDPFKGLGFQANYTYIKGETKSPLTLQDTPLAQVSKNNYNLVLIYEKGPFSSRLAYNWRDKFIDSFAQPGIQPTTVWVLSNDRMDFSASYDLAKNVTLTFDATNILGHKYHDNFGDLSMFTRDIRNYDRTIGVGVRLRF